MNVLARIMRTAVLYIAVFIFAAMSGVIVYARDDVAPGTILETSVIETVNPEMIRQEGLPLFGDYAVPAAQYQVRIYRVTFRSTDYDGSPADVVALLFVPLLEAEAELPLYVFGSGTTGIADKCAPATGRPEIIRHGYYRANMLAYAGLGFISVNPDYIGFNDPDRPQRYFVKAAEGHLMLDTIRAVYNFFEQEDTAARLSDDVFVAGYSQGGHAAFAAADMRQDYAPEVPLSGVIGYGSTTDVARLFREGPYYAPYILYTYSQIYDDIDPGDYLQEKWAETLPADVERMCVEKFQYYYPYDGTRLYKRAFYDALYENRLEEDYPALNRRIEENRSGVGSRGLPVLFIQGSDDIIAWPSTQKEIAAELCRAGNPVRYIEYQGARHRHSQAAGFQASLRWMEGVAEGKPAESDCSTLR